MSRMRMAALPAVLLVTGIAAASAHAAPPVATVSGPDSSRTGDGVGFDGSASSDPEGGRLTYAWAIDGERLDVAHDWLAVSFAYRGSHVIALTVTDPDGERATARHTIEVTGPDRPAALPGAALPSSLRQVLTAEPRVDLLAPSVRLRAHRLRVTVRCRGAVRCTGVLKARARLRRDGPRVLLGTRAFNVRAGTRALVRVPVRPGVRAGLERHLRLRVRLTAFRSRFPLSGVWDSLRYRLRR
jgi:hypothetical protein